MHGICLILRQKTASVEMYSDSYKTVSVSQLKFQILKPFFNDCTGDVINTNICRMKNDRNRSKSAIDTSLSQCSVAIRIGSRESVTESLSNIQYHKHVITLEILYIGETMPYSSSL